MVLVGMDELRLPAVASLPTQTDMLPPCLTIA